MAIPEYKDRKLFAFGKKDEEKEDQYEQQKSQSVDPYATHAPAYTGGVQHSPPGQWEGRDGRKEDSNVPVQKSSGLFGAFGKKDEVKQEQLVQEQRYCYGEGGNRQHEPPFALGKKDEEIQGQHASHQSESVDPYVTHSAAYTGEVQQTPLPRLFPQPQRYGQEEGESGQHQPQRYDEGDGKNERVAESNVAEKKKGGLLGAFGKKDKEKQDELLQQQSQSVGPDATPAPAYIGGVQQTPSPGLSQQPQGYGQGEGGNERMADSNVPEQKNRGLFAALGKKDEEKQDELMQQQTVNPSASHSPAYSGGVQQAPPPAASEQPQRSDQGECGNRQHEPVRYGQGDGGIRQHDPSFGKKDEEKQDQHPQQKSQTEDPFSIHSTASTGGVQHGPPVTMSQQPQRYGQWDGGHRQEEPPRHGQEEGGNRQHEPAFGKKDDEKKDEHVQQQSQTVDPKATLAPDFTGGLQREGGNRDHEQQRYGQGEGENRQHEAPFAFGKKADERQDRHLEQQSQTVDPFGTHSSASTGGILHAPSPALSQRPQRYGQGEGGNRQDEPTRYGRGEGGNRPQEPAFGKKNEEKQDRHAPDQYVQQQAQNVEPKAFNAPAFTGGAQVAPPPAVSQQPQRYALGEGRNRANGPQCYGQEEQRYALGEGRNRANEPECYGQEEDGNRRKADSYAPERKSGGLFSMFGKKDDEKNEDQHVQLRSHTTDPKATDTLASTDGVRHGPPPAVSQQPQRYGEGEDGNSRKVDSNIPEPKNRGLFGAFGKKDEGKNDQIVKKQSQIMEPKASNAPASTGGFQHAPPAGLSQKPQRYGEGDGGNRQHERQRYDQGEEGNVRKEDSSVPDQKNRGLFGMFGKKDEVKQDQHVQQQPRTVDPKPIPDPTSTGGVRHAPPPAEHYRQEDDGNGRKADSNVPENKNLGLFGTFGKKDDGKQDQQQSQTVDRKAFPDPASTGGVQQGPPAVSPQPQRYDHEEGRIWQHEPQRYGQGNDGNGRKPDTNVPEDKNRGVFGAFGKKDEGKQDQQQSQTVDPKASHTPASTGGVQQGPPPAVSPQPQRYGQGEGGNWQHEPQRYGQEKDETGRNPESNLPEDKNRGLFGAFGKKDERKQDQHMQQSPTVDSKANPAPAFAGGIQNAPPPAVSQQPQRYAIGEGENRANEPQRYGQAEDGNERKTDSDIMERKNRVLFAALSRKDDGKQDEHVQQKSQTIDSKATPVPASAGVVQHDSPPAVSQQPQRYGQREGGNKQHEPTFALGKKDEKKQDQHVPQQFQTVDPFATHSPASFAGVQQPPPAGLIQQPKRYGQVEGGNRQPEPAFGKKDEGIQHSPPSEISQQPQRYGQGEDGNERKTDSNLPEQKNRGPFGAFGKKDEEKPYQHVQQQSQTADPKSTPAPAFTGGIQHASPPPVSQQPQRYGQREGGNKQHEPAFAFAKKDEKKHDQHVQQQSQRVDQKATPAPVLTGGVQPAPPSGVSQQPQRYGQGEGGNKQHEPAFAFGKNDEKKQDQHVQHQSQTIDPKDSHTPASTGGVQHSPPLPVSQQPQSYSELKGGNKKQEPERYGQGQDGNRQHEPERHGQLEGGNVRYEYERYGQWEGGNGNQDQRYGYGEDGNRQHELQHYGQGEGDIGQHEQRYGFAGDAHRQDEYKRQRQWEDANRQRDLQRYSQGDDGKLNRSNNSPGYEGESDGKKKERKKNEIKEKLPGRQDGIVEEESQKKGLMEKIKEKLPGRKEGEKEL